jgi:hypothetical protein
MPQGNNPSLLALRPGKSENKGEEEEEALATNRKKIKVASLANSLAIYRDKLND